MIRQCTRWIPARWVVLPSSNIHNKRDAARRRQALRRRGHGLGDLGEEPVELLGHRENSNTEPEQGIIISHGDVLLLCSIGVKQKSASPLPFPARHNQVSAQLGERTT